MLNSKRKEGKDMSKKRNKKIRRPMNEFKMQKNTQRILFATAIINLLNAVLTIINKIHDIVD